MSTTIPVVRTAPGVAFAVIAPGGFRLLAAIDALTKVLGVDVTITAGTDHHTIGRHPAGEAYDLSVKGMAVPVVLKAKRFLEQTLGERFYVQYEAPLMPNDPQLQAIVVVNADATAPHLHCQVAKGTQYPPATPVGAFA
jgi:hypothetical protein